MSRRKPRPITSLEVFVAEYGGMDKFAAECGISRATAYRVASGKAATKRTRLAIERRINGLSLEELQRPIIDAVVDANVRG